MKPSIDSNIGSERNRSHARQRARIVAASVCHYQAPEHELPGGESLRERCDHSASLRAFRAVSARYLHDEARRHSWSDLLLFAIISGIAAWPICLTIEAAIQLLRS